MSVRGKSRLRDTVTTIKYHVSVIVSQRRDTLKSEMTHIYYDRAKAHGAG